MKTTITRLRARSHRSVTGALLLSTLTLLGVLLTLPALRADTVVKDPSGQTLQFGVSTLQADLHCSYESSHTPRTCVLMGMIDGRYVVCDADQSTSNNTRGKLYYVTLLGHGQAHFSGLNQDIITLCTMYGNPLPDMLGYLLRPVSFNYFKDNGKLTNYSGPARCQLVEWCDTSVSTDKLILIPTGGYGGSIGNTAWICKLQTSTNTGVPIQTLNSVDIKEFSPQGTSVIALDVIDLNRFSTGTNPYLKPSLAVWYNDNSQNGGNYDGNRYLPNSLISYSQQQDGSFRYLYGTKIPQAQVPTTTGGSGFGQRGYDGDYYITPNSVTGGFLLAPDGKGGFAYYFARNRIQWRSSTGYDWGTTSTWQWLLYSDIYSIPITCDTIAVPSVASSATLYSSSLLQAQRYCSAGGTWSGDDIGANHPFLQSSLQGVWLTPGIELSFTGNQAYVTPVSVSATNNVDTVKIGDYPPADNVAPVALLSPIPSNVIAQLNADLAITGGAVPSDTNLAVARDYTLNGVKVDQVFLGFPFQALPVDRSGNLINTNSFAEKSLSHPSISWSSAKVKISTDLSSSGNSSAWSAGYGVNFSVGPISGSVGAGVQGSYQNSQSHSSSTNVEFTATQTVDILDSNSFSQGIVTYVKTTPKVVDWNFLCWTTNGTTQTNLSVNGNTFIWPLMTVVDDVDPGQGQSLSVDRFCRTNPSLNVSGMTYLVQPDYATNSDGDTTVFSPYSPLSDGLIQFPAQVASTLIPYTNAAATRNSVEIDQATNFAQCYAPIVQWQNSNNIVTDLESFRKSNAGVTDFSTAVCQFTSTSDKELKVSHSLTDETSTEETKGAYANYDFGYQLSGEWNWSTGFGSSAMEETGNTYSIHLSASPSSLLRGGYTYYYYNIDVPALKSYMATHTYTLLGQSYTNLAVQPNWIPNWCWRNNQSFRLGFPWIK